MLSKSIQTQKSSCCMTLFSCFLFKKKKANYRDKNPLVGYQGLERQGQRLTTKSHEGILEDGNVLYIDYGVSHMLNSFVKFHKTIKNNVNFIICKLYLKQQKESMAPLRNGKSSVL